MQKFYRHPLHNQRGILTSDFILALTLAAGFSAILFSICFALSVVEATQYMAFSAARTHFGAHLDRNAQIDAGQAKFESLVGDPAFANLFSNGWFELGEPVLDDHSDTYGYAVLNAGDSPLFTGMRVQLNLRILSFDWPLIGSTGDENTYQAFITAFLGREPTLDECKTFTEARMNQLQAAEARFNGVGANNYYPMMDNGC